MSAFSRLRSIFSSPADRRLAAAEKEAWSGEPAPALPPAFAAADPGANPLPRRDKPTVPAIDWTRDAPPPPSLPPYQPGYNDHTFEQFAAPQGFEGWDLARIDAAVANHRRGTFVESSNLLVAVLGFAPVLAALFQAIAPILALRKRINGGDRGMAKEIAEELAAALVPSSGLRPSPYLPQELWGTMAIYLRMYGFCVLQHVDGDMDPETGVRPRFTRIWEPWSVQLQRNPRKRLVYTTQGTIEIKNDGKFTLVCDEQEPHLTGALVALGDEAFGGKLTQAQRAQWLDFFGDPKLVATLPEKVATGSEAGGAFKVAVEKIYGPGGRGVLPFGSTMAAIGITGEGSQAFRDALVDRIIHIYMVLTGSAGTIGAGGPTGAGPYVPQKGGAWNVRHDLIARPVKAIEGAINAGHVAPYLAYNYGQTITGAKRAGAWKDPVLEIPFASPDRDERIDGEIRRNKAYVDQLKAEKEIGVDELPQRARILAERFEVPPVTFAASSAPAAKLDLAPADLAKVVKVDEARASRGLPPIGGETGDLTISQLDAQAKAGATADANEGSGENEESKREGESHGEPTTDPASD